MRVSVKHQLIDGNLLGEKLFPVSKNAAIDTLKKWGFIDEQLQYIIPSLKKR
jgi:hypothetical protein